MKRLLLILGMACLSGVLLALALPPVGLWWLGPVCLVPVLAAVADQGLLRGFVGGILTPAICCATVLSGVFYRIPPGEGGSNWVTTGCGFFGILIAVVCCIQSETGLQGWRRIGFLSASALLLELALFPILPSHLALTQAYAPGVMLLASFGGIWLVSWVVWAANCAIADSLRTKSFRSAAGTFGILVLVYAAGLIPLTTAGPTLRVAAIQTLEPETDVLAKMNAEAGRQGAVLSVWPEFAGIMGATGGDPAGLRKVSASPGQPPFVTSYPDGFQPMPHNTAALFAGGRESERYYKQKLFGGEATWHTPGDRAVRGSMDGLPGVGLNICFDSCYPAMMRDTGRLEGVSLVALPTTDPLSTGAFIAAVHAAFTPFRAAESGVAIVRADGNAYSQIVDPTGRVVATLGPRVDGVLIGDVPIGRRWTPYSVLGDWMLWLAASYVLAEVALTLLAMKRRPVAETPLELAPVD